MSKRDGNRNVSSEEIVETYEQYGFTPADALRDARTHGYDINYGKGIAHGAIAGGIGLILGGVIDLAMAKAEQRKFARNQAERFTTAEASMRLAAPKPEDPPREENT